jgi:hypothetical protein
MDPGPPGSAPVFGHLLTGATAVGGFLTREGGFIDKNIVRPIAPMLQDARQSVGEEDGELVKQQVCIDIWHQDT